MSGHPGAEARDISLQAELALRTALNVLRDSIETERMPSGLALAPEDLAMHAAAIAECERLLAQQQGAQGANDNELWLPVPGFPGSEFCSVGPYPGLMRSRKRVMDPELAEIVAAILRDLPEETRDLLLRGRGQAGDAT